MFLLFKENIIKINDHIIVKRGQIISITMDDLDITANYQISSINKDRIIIKLINYYGNKDCQYTTSKINIADKIVIVDNMDAIKHIFSNNIKDDIETIEIVNDWYLYLVEQHKYIFKGYSFKASSYILDKDDEIFTFTKYKVLKNTIIITLRDQDRKEYKLSVSIQSNNSREKSLIGIPIYTDLH